MVSAFKLPSGIKENLYLELQDIATSAVKLMKYGSLLTEHQLQALAETLLGAGAERIQTTGKDDMLIVWNNTSNPSVRRSLSAIEPVQHWWETARGLQRNGVAPKFETCSIGKDIDAHQWRLLLNLADLLVLKYQSD